MNEMAKRWLAFAEEDLRMAQLAFQEGIYNQVCFHAQQCAEKALKAVFASQEKSPPRSHRIVDLLTGVGESGDHDLPSTLSLLDRFYIPTRYPDALPGTLPEGLPNEADAREALSTARHTLRHIRRDLMDEAG